MSAMSVSKSYAVLVGLEGYAKTRAKIKGIGSGVQGVFRHRRGGGKRGEGVGEREGEGEGERKVRGVKNDDEMEKLS